MLRNFCTVLTSVVFIWFTSRNEELNIDSDSATVVKEFDYVINSVIAHNKFDEYINEVEEVRQYLPYWNIF